MCCSAIRPRSNAPSEAEVRAWCWACAITCIDAPFNRGMPSQVKHSALRVREDLAVTSGAVVYRDAVCEVIQLVVAY